MRKLRRLSLLIWLPVLILVGYHDSAAALSGTLKQQILPLDCVYQVVNDGTGTIIYVTPNECGVLPVPTINSPTNSPTTQSPQVITVVDSGPAIFQIPFVPVASDPSSTEPSSVAVAGAQYLPYEQLTSVDEAKTQTAVVTQASATGTIVPIPVAIMGVSAIILLLLLLFF